MVSAPNARVKPLPVRVSVACNVERADLVGLVLELADVLGLDRWRSAGELARCLSADAASALDDVLAARAAITDGSGS